MTWSNLATKAALIASLALLVSAGAYAQEQTKEQPKVQLKDQPKVDDLAVAGATFGVSFFKGVGAAYKSGEAEKAYRSAEGSSLLDKDLTSLANAYNAKKEEGRATANLLESTGNVGIKGVVVMGLMSGAGTVPTALFAAGANYANKQVAIRLGEASDARAMAFLKEATQKWQTRNGVTYQSVREKLKNGDSEGAIKDFDNATGMLTDLRSRLSDQNAKDVAQNLILETMKKETEATITQTAENTTAIKGLADHVKVTQDLFKKTSDALENYKTQLNETDKAINKASEQIQALEQSQAITTQQVGAIEDILYEQQPPAQKIYLLQNNYRPGLTTVQRQQLITYYEAEKRKQDLISDTANVVNVAQEVQGILSNLGISDPTINKAVQIGTVAQKALSQAMTGNYLGAALAVTSLFGSQSDPESEHFAAIMGKLQEMDRKLNDILKLQVQTLEAIEKLSNQVADMDKRLNQRFDRVDFELKVISDNLRAVMWSSYMPCNSALENSKLDGTVKFNDTTFAFVTTADAARFTTVHRAKAIECARKLDDLFLSIKATQVLGPLLSLKTAVSTNFDVLPAQQDTTLTQKDLKGFLEDLYQPTMRVVNSAWDPAWGSYGTVIAFLGDPAGNVNALEQKLDILQQAKLNKKSYNACSAPTILSYRLRSLLCGNDRFGPKEVPKSASGDAERKAMERATRFMDEPLVRDQLPYLAEWTGLVARPYDFWTGSGDSIYSVDEILAGRGQQPWGRDLIFSLLSVLDIAIAQQSVLHGDVTTKFVYDFTWDKTAHAPIEPQQGTANTLQKDAIKLLQNKNNPWLGKNVLLMGLRDSLHSRDASGDLSIPYQKALSILNSAEDVGPEVNPSQLSDEQKKTQEERKKKVDAENLTKIQEANFALRGIFDVPDTVKFTFEDSDDGSGGRVRKDIFASGSYKLELPSPAEFARGQLSYPPSLISLLKLREVMTDRLVDYQLVRDISDPIEQKRVAGLLFSGLASSKQWANIGTQSSASAGVRVK